MFVYFPNMNLFLKYYPFISKNVVRRKLKKHRNLQRYVRIKNWNIIKQQHSYLCFGLHFTDNTYCSFYFLSQQEIRDKYSVCCDLYDGVAENPNKFTEKEKAIAKEFGELQFIDVNDAVRVCYTPDREREHLANFILCEINNNIDDMICKMNKK